MLQAVVQFGVHLHLHHRTLRIVTVSDLLGLIHCLKMQLNTGMGMHMGAKQIRNRATKKIEDLVALNVDDKINAAAAEWLDSYDDGDKQREVTG